MQLHAQNWIEFSAQSHAQHSCPTSSALNQSDSCLWNSMACKLLYMGLGLVLSMRRVPYFITIAQNIFSLPGVMLSFLLLHNVLLHTDWVQSSPSPTNGAQDLHENLLCLGDAAFPGLSNQNELNWLYCCVCVCAVCRCVAVSPTQWNVSRRRFRGSGLQWLPTGTGTPTTSMSPKSWTSLRMETNCVTL